MSNASDMNIDQVIAAQEANESDLMNARVSLEAFKARESELDKAYARAMVAIQRRIAAHARKPECALCHGTGVMFNVPCVFECAYY